MEENWKIVKGYEGLYMISDQGNVWSTRRKKILQGNASSGYAMVRLRLRGQKKPEAIFVHKLVALHFIENPHGKTLVGHIDGNPSNNRVENLKWTTPREKSLENWGKRRELAE